MRTMGGQSSEDSARQPSGQDVVVDADRLPVLFDALRSRGYTVVGPTVRDGAIVVAELTSATELPFGWGVETEAGRYRLRERADTAAFGHSAGPQSWKSVLHPARARLWSADRVTGTVETSTGETADPPRYALLGVRPCDVRAVGILDQVLTGGRHADPVYRGRRDGAFIIAVECTEPGATCFCTSMGGGPGAESGFDLAMTELTDAGGHRFVVRAGHARRRRRAGGPAEPGGGRGDDPARPHGGRRGGRPHGPHHADAGPAAAAGRQPRVPALGRRRLPLPDLRQLHHGLPHLLLHDHRGRDRPDGRSCRAVATLGLLLRTGLLLPARRQRAHQRAEPVPAVDHPQARHLARSVRLIRLRGLRAVHRLVPDRH